MSTLVLEVKNARSILKEEGVKALFKKYGWKLFAVVFTYYLVRDVTLYVLLPALIIKHL
jgi:hypothetical protein